MTTQPNGGTGLREGRGYPSPITKVLALGYYDGPTAGIIECGPGGPVYKFDMLTWDAETQDLRVFSLAPLPVGSLAELADALAQYEAPHWPVWVPNWRFPTAADQEAMERLTELVKQRATSVRWVIATSDLLGEILVARSVAGDELAQITDWCSFLGLPTQSTFAVRHR